MEVKNILKAHRTWEDGVGLLLGLAIGLTPWMYEEPPVPAVLLNSALTGLAVLLLAQLQLIRLRRWEDLAQLAAGLWLFSSPFIFAYAHQAHLRFWHWGLGALVVVLALLELWQDWDKLPRSPTPMTRRNSQR
jgi:SPW repeat